MGARMLRWRDALQRRDVAQAKSCQVGELRMGHCANMTEGIAARITIMPCVGLLADPDAVQHNSYEKRHF